MLTKFRSVSRCATPLTPWDWPTPLERWVESPGVSQTLQPRWAERDIVLQRKQHFRILPVFFLFVKMAICQVRCCSNCPLLNYNYIAVMRTVITFDISDVFTWNNILIRPCLDNVHTICIAHDWYIYSMVSYSVHDISTNMYSIYKTLMFFLSLQLYL